jgi:hypothetical protein
MCYRANFIRTFLFLNSLLLTNIFVSGQQLNTAVKNAYVITRMAEKFHFQPRPLNDEFSANIFTQLLKQLDEDRIFFTAGDINTLSKFRFELDDQIKKQAINISIGNYKNIW